MMSVINQPMMCCIPILDVSLFPVYAYPAEFNSRVWAGGMKGQTDCIMVVASSLIPTAIPCHCAAYSLKPLHVVAVL